MDFILFMTGPTCFTMGMVWLMTPNVFEVPLINPLQLMAFREANPFPNRLISPAPLVAPSELAIPLEANL